MSKLTRRKIEFMAEQIESAKNNYLREHGWVLTCDLPGAIYAWQKQLTDGRVVLASADIAIAIQDEMDIEANIVDPDEEVDEEGEY